MNLQDFPPAPLLPLIPGDPLELSPKNLILLYHQDLSHENLEILKAHTFPWIQTLIVLLIMALLPFALKKMREKAREEKPAPQIPIETLLQRLQGLSLENSKEAIATLSTLLREGAETASGKNTGAMTFQEICDLLKAHPRINEQNLSSLRKYFEGLEKLQYSPEPPIKGTLQSKAKEAEGILKTLTNT